MNRLVAFLLFCLYLPASLNATVTVHYCMGKMTGVDVLASAADNNRCSKCSMLKRNKEGCCHDTHQTIKVNKDQLAATGSLVSHPSFHFIQSDYASIQNMVANQSALIFYPIHSPPLLAVSLLLLYCVFCI